MQQRVLTTCRCAPTSACDDSLRGFYTHANAFWRPGQAQYHVSCHILRGRRQLLLTKGVGARELHERAPVMDFRKCELGCVR